MRVVLLVGRSTGGIGTHVDQLARDLRRGGTDVVVVTHPSTAQRFGWHDARPWWPDRSAGAVASLRRLWRLRRLAAGADVLHAHGHQAGLLATLLSLTATRPAVIVSQHNMVLPGSGLGRVKTWAQRWVARRADLLTGASRDLVEQARALGAVDARLAAVPSPKVPALLAADVLDTAGRERLRERLLGPAGAGFPLVLTISRIAPQKDLGTLVEAAAALRALCRWVVVGDGDPDLRRGLEDRVRRTGAPVELVGARADAADLPVVASDAGGLRDLVQGVGLLVPVGDAAILADQVEAVLLDPDLHATLASRSRRAAAALPDGAGAAGEWLTWYAAVVDARGGRWRADRR